MARRYIKKKYKDAIEWDGIMRLVEGVVLHILDKVAISKKWKGKDISMRTLLMKRDTLKEMHKWMKGWQWGIWVNIYAEHNGYNSRQIKNRFESIRKKSTKIVNKRINEKQKNRI